jgi:hypothetical protein
MNYEKIYQQLIDRAITRTLTGYKERHHIVPKCMGGDNSKLNLVDLTAREHFIAHKLLCEIYPNTDKLQYALWMMINKPQSRNQQRLYTITNREYDRIKLLISKTRKSFTHSEETKNKIRQSSKGKIPWNKGLRQSDVTRQKISIANKDNTAHNKGKKHSDATRQKMSIWQQQRINLPKTEEHKQKISKTLIGRKRGPMTNEHKQKIREAKLNKKYNFKLGFNQ